MKLLFGKIEIVSSKFHLTLICGVGRTRTDNLEISNLEVNLN